MSSKTTTKLGNGLYRETTRNDGGGGKSVTYRPGLIFRDVKEVTKWKGKRK